MRTPKDLFNVTCFPWDPDDKGGGFACIEVNETIYNEKQLNNLIKTLEKRRKWIAWQSEGRWKRRPQPKGKES